MASSRLVRSHLETLTKRMTLGICSSNLSIGFFNLAAKKVISMVNNRIVGITGRDRKWATFYSQMRNFLKAFQNLQSRPMLRSISGSQRQEVGIKHWVLPSGRWVRPCTNHTFSDTGTAFLSLSMNLSSRFTRMKAPSTWWTGMWADLELRKFIE